MQMAFALLEVEGVPEVDDGAVIGHEGVLSLGGAAAQLVLVLALEGGDFVFGASGGGLDQVEEFGPAGAGVEFIDGADRGVLVLFVARVVGGVLHEVTVAGPDFPIIEFGKGGQQVVMGTQGREVVGAQVAGKIAHHGEAARAFEGGEVVAAGQVRNLWDGVGLEEIAPGFGVRQASKRNPIIFLTPYWTLPRPQRTILRACTRRKERLHSASCSRRSGKKKRSTL